MAAAKAIRRNKPTPQSSSLRSADSSPSQGEPGMEAASPSQGSRVWRLLPLVKGTVSPHKEGSGVQKRQDKTGQELTNDLPRFSVIFERSAQARLALLLPHSHKRFICILAEPSDDGQYSCCEEAHESGSGHWRRDERENDDNSTFDCRVYAGDDPRFDKSSLRDRMVLVNDWCREKENRITANGNGDHRGGRYPAYIVRKPNRDRPQPDGYKRAHPMRVRVRAADEHTERQPSGNEYEHVNGLSQYEARGHKQYKYQQRRKRAFDTIGIDLLQFGIGAVSHQHICHNNRQLFHGTHLSGNADTF